MRDHQIRTVHLAVCLGLTVTASACTLESIDHLGFELGLRDVVFRRVDAGDVQVFVPPGTCGRGPVFVPTGENPRDQSFSLVAGSPDWLSVRSLRGASGTERTLCAAADAPANSVTRVLFTNIIDVDAFRFRDGRITFDDFSDPVWAFAVESVVVRWVYTGTLLVATVDELVVEATATPAVRGMALEPVQLHARASGGQPPYTLRWLGPSGVVFSSSTAAEPIATNVPAERTELQVLVEDALGLSAQGSVIVTVNERLPTVTISATDADARENGPDPGTFTISRTGLTFMTFVPLTVSFTIAGTAANGADYHIVGSTVTIAPGATSATAPVTIVPIDDDEAEGPETVVVTLAANAAYAIGLLQSTATVTIADNDDLVPRPLSVTASAMPATVVGGQTTQLSASVLGGSPPYAFSWSPAIRLTDRTIANPLASPGVSTTYTVTVTDAVGTVASAGVTVTVQNIETVVTISAPDPGASETGPDPGTLTVSRSGSATSALTVNYTIGGTATNGTDYRTIANSVTIPAGTSSATVTITPIDDALVEAPEQVVLTLTSGAGYIVGTVSTATVTIADNDLPVVSIVATDNGASESGADPGTFTISRTGPTTAPLTVSYVVGGTATNGVDYRTIAPSVTIPAGASAAGVVITPIDDSEAEGPQTVVLTLATSAAYTIGTGSAATVTIADNDLTVVTIEATDPLAQEPEQGAPVDTGTFTIRRFGATSAPLIVGFTRSSGPGLVNGVDYVAFGSSITIPAGQAQATITVTPRADPQAEGDVGLMLTLSASAAYAVGTPASAAVTIRDNAAVMTIAATDPIATEPDQGTPADTGTFTFRRANNLLVPLTVSFTRSTGPGLVNAVDYAAFGSSITISAGQAQATITVTPRADAQAEGDVGLTLTLSASTAYVVGTSAAATVTIRDNAAVVTIAATDPIAAEPDQSTPADTGTFTVRRANNLLVPLTVGFTRSTGRGLVNAVDYAAFGSSITLPAGQAHATITVTPRADAQAEGDVGLTLTISASTAYVSGTPAAATVTIRDNAAVVTIAATDPIATEPGQDTPADTGTFTFRRANNLLVPLTVSFTRSTGSGLVNAVDYAAFGSSITLPAGQAHATITVTPRADAQAEGDVGLTLTLSASTAYVVGTPATATVTIRDRR